MTTTPRGRLFVVSGPSGVGKDAVLERVFLRLPNVVRSVSATTRAPRYGETDGVDYHFMSHDEFKAGIAKEFFFEYAQYGENYYGTPRNKVAELQAKGCDVILKIEVQGAAAVKALAPEVNLVFIQPPSFEELESRLRGRASETEEKIQERLAIARCELERIPDYDYLVTNDDLDTAVETVCAIIVAARHRIGK